MFFLLIIIFRNNQIKKEREEAAKEVVVWPVVLKIMPEHVFNIKNPIVLGCEVQEGLLLYWFENKIKNFLKKFFFLE